MDSICLAGAIVTTPEFIAAMLTNVYYKVLLHFPIKGPGLRLTIQKVRSEKQIAVSNTARQEMNSFDVWPHAS